MFPRWVTPSQSSDPVLVCDLCYYHPAVCQKKLGSSEAVTETYTSLVMFKDTGFKYYCGITHAELLVFLLLFLIFTKYSHDFFFWQAWIPTWRVRRSCCWKQATRKWWTRSQTPTALESAPSVQAQPPSSAVQYNTQPNGCRMIYIHGHLFIWRCWTVATLTQKPQKHFFVPLMVDHVQCDIQMVSMK